MAFFKNNRLASKGAALKTALGNISNPLFKGLISRYTEVQRTSAVQDANKRYTNFWIPADGRMVCTAKCQDKVLCYLFALCLILNDFTVEINQLAHDIQIKPSKYSLL
jgi:DNA-directed RNA polymerase I subunit RPA49